MKVCKKCGAVQNDDRSVCIDCGSVLGKSVSDEEEHNYNENLSEYIDDKSERTEDFYVSRLDKIIGILCIIIGLTCIFVMNNAGVRLKEIESDIQAYAVDDISSVIITANGVTTVLKPDSVSDDKKMLEYAYTSAGISLLFAVMSCLEFLCPKLIWKIESLKYTLWYRNFDDAPSDFAMIMHKFSKKAGFVIVIISFTYALYCIYRA